ncbi:MAG: transporter [Bacteroidales bacterium]|nr:transporter [Bacteroidales bacterium]
MNRFRNLVLPIAIVLGLIFHSYCGILKVGVPYLIFTILLLNFVATDIKKMRFTVFDAILMAVQVSLSLGIYLILHLLGVDEIVSQGVLVGVLCPVAASVVVISCMLGANRETVTAYTIFDNLLVALLAPVIFSFVGEHQDMPFGESFLLIIRRVAPIIALPFFVAWLLQRLLPKANAFLVRYRGLSFYLWAVALFITLGQTIDFIMLKGEENLTSIIILGVVSVLFCVVQFGVGKLIGRHYGDTIAGGQLLGQKNSALGIWMANTYLNPLSAVFPALYSIWQNLFNSWQLWRNDKKVES